MSHSRLAIPIGSLWKRHKKRSYREEEAVVRFIGLHTVHFYLMRRNMVNLNITDKIRSNSIFNLVKKR